MSESYTFFYFLALLALISLWLGWRAKDQAKTKDEYFLMGRKINVFSLMMTFLATQMGGAALMGTADEAYLQGWKVIFFPLGMGLGLLVLGLGYGAKIRKLNVATIPEIFQTVYGSPLLRKLASFLSIMALFFVLVGQGIAARKLFISITPNGNLAYLVFWLVLVLYTTMGGLKAVVRTDILQGAIIFLVFGVALGASFYFHTPSERECMIEFRGETDWSTWLLMPLFFTLIGQDIGQRCLAAKSPRTVSIAACLASGLLFLISLVPLYFGAMARKYGIPIPGSESVLITAIHTFTHPVVSTFAICAILVAIVSTADSVLCSMSATLSYDFSQFQSSLFTAKAITFLFGIMVLALSFYFDNVFAVFMTSFKLVVSVLFVPVTFSLWVEKPKKRSAVIAMSVGLVSFLVLRIWAFSFPKELITLALAFSCFMTSEWLKQPAKSIV
ncbi:MAG: sodium:solute symporter family protein [Chlamydiales bacterium]